jgi:hypothetical protein
MDIGVEIISDLELDHILNSVRNCGLEEIGGKEWVSQMSMLEELNVQSALEAEKGLDERVRDAMVEADKLPLVVREAILLELWREEIMVRILKMGEPVTSFQFYMTLFNEANLVNILETALFHGPAAESLGDSAVDISDYCVRQMTKLLSEIDGAAGDAISMRSPYAEVEDWRPGMPVPEIKSEEPKLELERQAQTTRFQVLLIVLNILIL